MTTIANTADHATEHAKEAASHARGTILELATLAVKLFTAARAAEVRGMDTVLDRLGLQRRRSAWRPVLWFAAGAASAAGAVYLAAPTSGKSIRRRIAQFLDDHMETLATEAKGEERRAGDGATPEIAPAKRPANGAKHDVG